MNLACDYAVLRANDDTYRLDRVTPPFEGPVAFVKRVTDRLGKPRGWRLKPLVTMQGSKSKVWSSPAEALASTRLMTISNARTAILNADRSREVSTQEAVS